MPASNQLVDDGLGIITTCSGVLTSDEFLAAVIDRYEPPAQLLKLRFVLTDHLAVEKFELSIDVVKEVGRISLGCAEINPHICLVGVSTSDLGYGLMRVWRGYADQIPWRSRIFRARDEAEAWIRRKVDSSISFEARQRSPNAR